MHRQERHDLILKLISSRPISRQDELAQLLRDGGFTVTQASISRDLDELGVVKVDGSYKRIDVTSETANPFRISAIRTAGDNLIVVKCASGMASAATVRIDSEGLEEIVGTIAGDDTIFVAVDDVSDQKAAVRKLRTLFARG